MANPISLPTTDIAWGIDRYEYSKAKGELSCPVIFMWKLPACKPTKDNLIGAVEHGTELTVTKRKLKNERNFYYAACEVEHEGKIYRQKGWVSAMMLKMLGDQEHKRDNGDSS